MDTSYLKQLSFKPACEIIRKYKGNREVVFFGDSAPLRIILKNEYGIETKKIATRVKEYTDKENYYFLEYFSHQNDNYYITIPFLEYDEKIVKKLNEMGYQEYQDFAFVKHKPVTLISPVRNYSDEYGNQIDCPAPGLRIVLDKLAGNNKVKIDESVKFGKGCVYHISDYDSELEIEKNCRFGTDSMFLSQIKSKIKFERDGSTGHHFDVHGSACSEIIVKKDFMFSHYVMLMSGDGHAIFDTKLLKRTNPLYPINEKHRIIIGEHCWIGYRSAILYNTKIGSSSIIGTQSLVKGSFPNNCVIAGTPAKVIRQNVTWHRHPYATEINEVDWKYVHLTNNNE